MPLRKEPPTPRSAAVAARLDGAQQAGTSSATALGPLIPVRPGETSLRRQAILTEDEYTSALSAVIKRDFFPDLDRMTAENEYLAAVEADDPRRIRTALERLLSFDGQQRRPASTARTTRSSGRQTSATGARATRGEWDDTPVASASTSKVFDPTLTPAISTPGLDAPLEEQGSDEAEPSSGIVPDVSLSLADFQARYTSEDNASFAQLLERGNEERKRKHAWLYARERASIEQRRRIQSVERQEAEVGRRLAIEANPDHPKLIAEGKTKLLLEGKGGSKATEPESAPSPEPRPKQKADPMDDLILVPEPRRDDRRAPPGLGRWKYTARNALLFGPDANADYLRPPSAETATDGEATTNFAAIRRLDGSGGASGVEAEGSSEAGWSPSSSRVDAAIARGRAGSIASSFDAHDSPRVNGYGFVTPYLTPQHALDDEHLRIYNAIKARRTPVDADAHTQRSAGGMGFELPRLDKREELAQRLVSTPSSAKRAKPSPYGTQKYGGLAQLRARAFASPAKQSAAALSPAARALLDRSTRTLTPAPSVTRTASAHGSTTPAVRIGDRGWTPTPQHPQRRAR
ncbi:hypothetical protein PaG_02276 [Moesziomyces aphidis]|uniref:Uncharacterized protein n=1 Tax=Moesziomyces aphidis TaxID=84754 RepID=W3VR39_MOEAP|nr:hypothetical protein PaG_02276 [Moesziomyces aphidis]